MLEQIPEIVNHWTDWYMVVGYVLIYVLIGTIAGRYVASICDNSVERKDYSRATFLFWPIVLTGISVVLLVRVAVLTVDTLLGNRDRR